MHEVILRLQRKDGNSPVKMTRNDFGDLCIQKIRIQICHHRLESVALSSFSRFGAGNPGSRYYFFNISIKAMNDGGYEEGVLSELPAAADNGPIFQERKQRRCGTDSQQSSALSEMTGLVGKLFEQYILFVSRITAMDAFQMKYTKKQEEGSKKDRMERL